MKPCTFSLAEPVNQNDSIGSIVILAKISSFMWVSGLALDCRQSGTV